MGAAGSGAVKENVAAATPASAAIVSPVSFRFSPLLFKIRVPLA